MFEVIAITSKLEDALSESKEKLLESLTLNVNRQVNHHFDEVKKQVMIQIEEEIDKILEICRKNMKLQIETNGKVFSLNGTMPMVTR